MPSKSAQHIAFFFVLFVSAGLHWYVYANLKRVLLRDYPKLGQRLAKIALALFIVMDSPFAFLYFRGEIHGSLTALTRFLLYPFSVWQTILLMWAIVLVPFSLWRMMGHASRRPFYLRDVMARLRKRADEAEEDDIALEVVTE
ncbi:MAG TPA: hypothetical protein VFD13_00875 [Candidatus Kapabacteria bacterium]|nr:hypothetical protein [Candidatus Kapabacteria bacterium]